MRSALESVPGVRNVEVNFDASEAYASFEPGDGKVDAMIAALGEAGYDAAFKRWGRP